MSVTPSSAFTQAVVVLMHRIGPRCSCACIYAGPNVITSKPRSTSTTRVKKLASKVPPSKSPGDMHTAICVQKLERIDSAVRIRHLSTGIVVTCQNERSQIQNREVAMKLLKARLYEREQKKREEEAARLKGEYVQADFGTQIRSVTIHPYNIVKDHRTNYESGDTDGYLAGDVDPFIYAYLQAMAGGVAAEV